MLSVDQNNVNKKVKVLEKWGKEAAEGEENAGKVKQRTYEKVGDNMKEIRFLSKKTGRRGNIVWTLIIKFYPEIGDIPTNDIFTITFIKLFINRIWHRKWIFITIILSYKNASTYVFFL